MSDVACAGHDDKLIIYLTNANHSNEVKSFISKKTSINFRAFEIVIIDEIPKSSSGKIIYADLPV